MVLAGLAAVLLLSPTAAPARDGDDVLEDRRELLEKQRKAERKSWEKRREGPLRRTRTPGAKPRIVSDNGPQFIANDFKSFIRIQGLTHVRTSPYYP